MNIKAYILTAIMAITATAQAQESNSAYFLEDMTARHDLNPAFGNSSSYFAIPALGSVNIKMQGNFGIQDILFKDPQTGKYKRTFMHPDIPYSEALSGFSKGINKVTADASITLLSAGFNAFGGYNTVEIRGKTTIGLRAPYELFEFAKDLKNQNYRFDDIHSKGQSYVSVGFGHSRQITDKLRVGAKLNVLLGMANVDVSIEGLRADLVGDKWVMTSDKAEANVNIKGIQFNNKTSEYDFRNGNYEYVNLGDIDIDGFGIGGYGLGLDLGAEYQIQEGLKVSGALLDIGFISWKDTHTLRQRSSSFIFDGFHELKIKNETTQPGEILDDQFNNYSDQMSDFLRLTDVGNTGGKTTVLGATMNVAGQYTLPSYQQLTLGLMAQHRFNGDLSWTEGRLSANWSPLDWLNGGVNFAVSDLATSVGWVLNFHPKGYNFFIGMDHAFCKLSKDLIPLSSNTQLSIGMSITWNKKSSESKRKEETQEELFW